MSEKRILFLLDASGSMSAIYNDAIGGFNAWKATLELVENDVRITLALFNEGSPRIVYDDVPVRDVPDLTPAMYRVDNSTALYDAIAFVINRIDKKMQRGDSALIVVLTDGHENASYHHSYADITKMIKDREALGWAFSYISASPHAVEDSAKIGIAAASTVTFATTSEGTKNAYRSITNASLSYLSGEKETYSTWTDENS